MAKLFYDLIVRELKTLEQVPVLWKEQVAEMIANNGKVVV